MRALIIFQVFTALVLLSGCGGGGNSQTGGGDVATAPKSVGITVEFDKFLLNKALQRRSTSRTGVSKSLFPNLGSIQLSISTPDLPLQEYSFSASETQATVLLAVGHVYSIVVSALNTTGQEIARGVGDLNLETKPPEGVKPRMTIKLEVTNTTTIISSVWPDGGNVLPGQNIYFFLNQPGKIHYSVNGGPFLTIGNVSSTAGQEKSASNGTPVAVSGQVGEIVNVRYVGEDELGNLEEVQQANFNLIRIGSFRPLRASQVPSKLMTSANYGVAQLVPVNR